MYIFDIIDFRNEEPLLTHFFNHSHDVFFE